MAEEDLNRTMKACGVSIQTTDNDLSHTVDVVARSEKGQRVIIDNFILHTLGQGLLGVEESSN